MDIARQAIARPINTWMLATICVIGGLVAYLEMGRLEDPAFTIPLAVVTTDWPGASAEEVEQLVTEPLESAIQQMKQIWRLTSRSRPGFSEITIEIADTYPGDMLPQVWDELRRKVGDAAPNLPRGAGPPRVNDDFGDVAGIYLALTGPGYPLRLLHEQARELRRELLRVPGVARIDLAGYPGEHIVVEIAQSQLAALELPPATILAALDRDNAVLPAGQVRSGDYAIRIAPDGDFATPQSIAALPLAVGPGSVRLGDIADVRREYVERPAQLIRHNGEDAITLAIAVRTDLNIVEVGRAIDQRLAELDYRTPPGMALSRIYDQPAVVDDAITTFMLSLALSVGIVILALCVSMGWRVGVIVGSVLLLTVLGTLFVMFLLGVEMERISLGALIIAMGMLVDNAIVVCEGVLVRLQRGLDRIDAAAAAVMQTRWPLLGATLVGVLAFSGIGLSPDSTGEFLGGLFVVIAVSLLLSWVLAVTLTPLFGYYLLPAEGSPDAPLYDHWTFRAYRRWLDQVLRWRWLALAALLALTATSVWGFRFVTQGFFPESNAPLMYVNYWLPMGSDIRATARDAERIGAYLREQPDVVSVTELIGAGGARFMLTYEPEMPDPSYAQFIVRTASLDRLDDLVTGVRDWVNREYPDAESRVIRPGFGPGAGAKILARFSGPEAGELRRLAAEAERIMSESGRLTAIRSDWRRPELTLVPRFDPVRAREAGLTRADLLDALLVASDGLEVGAWRDGDRQLPILLRAPAGERGDPALLADRLVWTAAEARYVPLGEVAGEIELENREALIRRLDRARTLAVEADAAPGGNTDAEFRRIRPLIEAIELPPGYRLSWGGEYENTLRANESLARQLPVSFAGMVIVIVLLFGALRESLLIWLIVPMSIIGVTAGLIATGLPFTFPALLGFLGLSGMLIKNAIVLVDEIHLQARSGIGRYRAVLDGSVARLRPVMLAAGTTILGMIPLLADRFFVSMAVTIMSGLAFATVLTLVAVPVLYSILYRVRPDEPAATRGRDPVGAQP